MHSRVDRSSEGSDDVPVPEGPAGPRLAPPVGFLPPYHVGTDEHWGQTADSGKIMDTTPGLTLDEAIAQLNADAEE